MCMVWPFGKLLILSDMIQLVFHGLAQMRIGTKSFLGLSFKQVGLWFHSSLELWFITTSLQVVNSTTPSPSIPPSAPTVSGENLLIPFMIFYIFLCLLCRTYGAKHPEIYKTSTTASLHFDAIAGLGATHVGGNQLFELGEGDRVDLPHEFLEEVTCPKKGLELIFSHLLLKSNVEYSEQRYHRVLRVNKQRQNVEYRYQRIYMKCKQVYNIGGARCRRVVRVNKRRQRHLAATACTQLTVMQFTNFCWPVQYPFLTLGIFKA